MRANSENSFPWKFSTAEVPRELHRQNVFVYLSQLVRLREGLGGAHTAPSVVCELLNPPNPDVVSVDILRTD